MGRQRNRCLSAHQIHPQPTTPKRQLAVGGPANQGDVQSFPGHRDFWLVADAISRRDVRQVAAIVRADILRNLPAERSLERSPGLTQARRPRRGKRRSDTVDDREGANYDLAIVGDGVMGQP